MATFVTNFSDSAEFLSATSGGDLDFLSIDALGQPLTMFAGDPRLLGEGPGETAFHRTGDFDGGFFLATSGSGSLLSETSWNVNGLLLGGEFMVGVFSSTAGLTIAPPASDEIITGTINSATVLYGVPGDSYFYDFVGTIALPTTPTGAATINARQIHFRSEETEGEDSFFREGTIGGTFAINVLTETVTGTITSVAMNINGSVLEASGFSVSAATFFNAESEPQMEALFAAILAGNDAITGSNSGGQLNGYAGNDTITAGADNQVLNGGLGADVYELGFWGGLTIAEAAGQGIDTIRSMNGYTLQEGSNIENLILTGTSEASGTGNELANTIVGNSGENSLNGAEGADSLVGGGGDDSFYLDNVGDKLGAEAADGSYDAVYSTVTHVLGLNFEDLILDGEAAINGTGNAAENFIAGNQNANVLTGLGGDDELQGSNGNDKLDGGDGDDFLNAGNGSNTVLGGTGDDYLGGGEGNSDNDLLDGGAGNDYLYGGGGANTVLGGAGDDNLNAGNENDLLNGGDGNDYLRGGGGANTVLGGAGNDDMQDSGGDSFFDGGAGNDSITTGDSDNTVFGGLGDDTMSSTGGLLDGGAGNDDLSGGDGDITLIGGAGNDNLNFWYESDSVDGGAGIDYANFRGTGTVTLSATTENLSFSNVGGATGIGNALANTFFSNAGADTFNGAGGNDTYFVQGVMDVVQESSDGGTDLVFSYGSFTLGDNVEGLTLSGSTITGAGNLLGNVLTSYDGSQIFDGKGGNDTYNVQIDDLAGEDSSGSGTDLVNASLYDTESFMLGNFIENLTLFDLGEGTVSGFGNELNNVIRGAVTAGANNYLYGDAGADSLIGGTGADTLEGGEGNDTMVGGLGDDIFFRRLTTNGTTVTMDSDVMTDTGGSDTVMFEAQMVDTLGGGTFTLNLATQAGFAMIDNLNASEAGGLGIQFNFTGNAGNNRLEGAEGADSLNGGAGNDTLIGGTGADSLMGGAGNDYYVQDGDNFIGETVNAGTMDIIEVTAAGGDFIISNFGTGIFEGAVLNHADAGSVTGGAGNDFLGSKGGVHTLSGATGNDTYSVHVVGDAQDTVLDTGGTKDLVIATLADGQAWIMEDGNQIENLTLIHAGVGTITATGNDLANLVTGATGADADNSIHGAGGNDTLLGGAGADTLQGGAGNDSLAGGLGNDNYRVNLKDTVVGALSDTIADTGGTDTLTVLLGEGVTGFTHTLLAAIENIDLSNLINLSTNVTGNAAANSMFGSSGNSRFDGGAGNDSLDGFMGADTLLGGAGNDFLEGGEGDFGDVLDGGAGNDDLNGGEGNDTLDGGLGDDYYYESLGDDTYVIAQAHDWITEDGPTGGTDTIIVKALVQEQSDGGEGFINLNGDLDFIENATYTGAGAVQMFGNEDGNVLTANAGNDLLDGAEGSDTLIGGAGNDELWGGAWDGGNDSMSGDAGNDTLDGGEGGSDTLIGGEGNDILDGGESAYFESDVDFPDGNDYLDGGNGSDMLDGGEGGSDTLIGGAGDDRLYGGGFAIDGVEGDTETFETIGPDGDDFLTGDAGNDTLDGGEGGADTLMGGLGNDSLYGGNMSPFSEIDGFIGPDEPEFVGGFVADGDDYIDGGAGHDSIDGGEGGADTLIGGEGNDSIDGGEGGLDGMFDPGPNFEDDGADYLDGNAGNDNLDGGEGGADTLIGGDGNDSLYGGSDDLEDSNDNLSGGAGNDSLDGGYGADTMAGGAGNDTYWVDDNNDVIVDEAAGLAGGTDKVTFSSEYHFAADNIENFTFGAGAGNLLANAQANTIVGNSGNNSIVGGGGNDTVTGGTGADLFVLGHGSDTVVAGNVMAIQDFHLIEGSFGGDQIGLSSTAFAEILGDGISAAEIVNGTLASGGDAQLIYTYGNATTAGQLFYDADGDGDGAAVLVATFAVGNKPAMLSEDIFTAFNGFV